MTTPPSLLAAITTHVRTVGDRLPARTATRHWAAADPGLTFLHPAAALSVAERLPATDVELDRLCGALASLAPTDEWAGLTLVAIAAPRLRAILRRWAVRGARPDELVDLEAELVARLWALLRQPAGPPRRPGGGIPAVHAAWSSTRTARTTELRRAARSVPLEAASSRPATGGPTADEHLTSFLAEAVASGTVTPRAASAWWATRVGGQSAPAAARTLGTTQAAVRKHCARANARLAERLTGEAA